MSGHLDGFQFLIIIVFSRKIYTVRIILFFFSLIAVNAFAQQSFHRCYTTEYMDILEQQRPGIKAESNALFEAAMEYAHEHYSHKGTQSTPDTIYRIPVVFHVVYNGSNQNTDYALLESQIQVLNEDYRRLNADTSNTRPIFKDRAADVGFEFFLATIDPDGNPTSGVTRTPTTSTFNFFDLDAMKSSSTGGKDAWDTQEYLNIWVCDLGGLVLGFAYPPTGAPNWPAGQGASSANEEGVVIHYEVIGKNNPLATGQLNIADQGRTAVHEVGHYWGLRHIWGDSGSPFSPGPDCDITKDDGFSDTPHAGNNSQSTGCSFGKNSCSNGESPDEPDMVENYMDYSTERCQNMFTQQQADLMRSMAVIGRPGLAKVIANETYELEVGHWIVVNGTDTFQIANGVSIPLENGDQVMLLNMNNGYDYTLNQGDFTLTGPATANLVEDGTVSFTLLQTSIRELYQTNISLYPNPASSSFTLQHDLKDEHLTLEVVNQIGQVVLKKEILSTRDVISTQDLNTGIYFVKIKNHLEAVGIMKLQILK